jgi:hypothetical protein
MDDADILARDRAELRSYLWPYYPLLSMYRRLSWRHTWQDFQWGVIFGLQRHIIYRGKLWYIAWGIPEAPELPQTIPARLHQAQQHVYDSPEALLADGWRVDWWGARDALGVQ